MFVQILEDLKCDLRVHCYDSSENNSEKVLEEKKHRSSRQHTMGRILHEGNTSRATGTNAEVLSKTRHGEWIMVTEGILVIIFDW